MHLPALTFHLSVAPCGNAGQFLTVEVVVVVVVVVVVPGHSLQPALAIPPSEVHVNSCPRVNSVPCNAAALPDHAVKRRERPPDGCADPLMA